MADQKTIDKVKALLEGHCYGPLREAAEKWLEAADEKYDVKEKAGKAWDKLGDAADAVSDASIKFNEKMGELSDKAAPVIEDLQEKAGPAIDKAREKAAPAIDKLQEKAAPTLEKLAELELIKQLKEGVSTFSDNINLFGSEKGAEIAGSKEAAEQIKKHAEAMKAEGKTFCDCDACTKAREILKDLGEDIGE